MSFQKTAGKNDIQEQFLLTGDFVECLVFWGLADFGHTINLEKYFLLEDELFQENKRKAQLEAYKIGFKLLFVVIWLMAIGMFSRNVEWCAIFMLISVSLIYALVLFLSNYLLYRYEKRE